ncbi:sporulation sensor histidine kinase KinB [Calditerricola satsumensis]|uniref:histidine kinase n=1 Tax=Calditerricola satsumensis TaxID=373054 RepID=A0A8J3BF87_9BACI|nr:sporulation kinase B [Calditerricola satsumensis]
MDIRNLLLNVLILLFAFFVYQMVWAEKHGKFNAPNHLFITVLAFGTVVLCAVFPIFQAEGFLYDLGAIPVLMCLLYGEARSALLVAIGYVFVRTAVSGAAWEDSAVPLAVSLLLSLWLRNRWESYPHRKRIGAFVALDALYFLLSVAWHVLQAGVVPVEAIPDEAVLLVVHATVGGFLVHLCENLRATLKMKMEIERIEKFNALAEMAASIAHEIRNPLTVARGFLQLLKQQTRDARSQTYLTFIVDELDRAESIIGDYLSFCKPKPSQESVLDVGTHVQYVVNVITPFAHLHNVEMHLRVEPGLSVYGDGEKLNQVLMNLMKNAVEAMPWGGTLSVSALREERWIRIDIQDTGLGMTEEELKRIGTPFFSTKKDGTGLGLTVSYRIVQSMNGRIDVRSEKGKGTCFSVRLPAADQPTGR